MERFKNIQDSIDDFFNGVMCKIGSHTWKYYNKTVPIKFKKRPGTREITVPLRKCISCGCMEHHLMPTSGNMSHSWKPISRVIEKVIKEK